MTACPYWLLLLVPAALAQTTIKVVPGAAIVGGSGSATITLDSPSSAAEPVALEWTLTYSTSVLSGMNLSAGAALTSAGKSLSCVDGTGEIQCIIWGVNNTPIPNGVLATASFAVSSKAPTSSSLGLTGLTAVSSSATPIAATASGATLTISSGAKISKLACPSTSITTPAEVVCTVTLASAAADAVKVDVGLDYEVAEVTLPRTVTVPAGQRGASYTVSAGAVAAATKAILVASVDGSSATFTLSLLP